MAADPTVSCPRCLSLNPVGATVCRQCGAPLGEGATPAPRGSSWSTLILVGLWLFFGPGVLMPLFYLSPGFVSGPGAMFRIVGSALYFIASVAVLGWVTARYFRRG
jgi:hypothetical protein